MDCEKKLTLLQKEFEDFTYIVSHDLKAPIRAISNLTEWIEEDLSDQIEDDIKENLKLLRKRTEKMGDMISAITELSRINRRELDIISVNVQKVFNDIKGDLEHRYKGVTINIPKDEILIFTYAKKLQRVLGEIIENAVKHNEDRSSEIIVSVQVINNTDSIEFIISDNGKGVSNELLGNLTQMFYTLEPKDKSKTLGAGLAIVKKTLDFVGGSIEFKNEQNKFQVNINWPIK